jgi:hypothetical protein
MAALDACVSAALVASAMPSSVDEARGWLEHAELHRVHVLLAERWLPLAGADPVLGGIRDSLRKTVRTATMLEAIRDLECRRVYAALSRQGFRVAVIKGAALAHTTYPASHLRPRCDTDILIERGEAAAVACALTQLGYDPEVETSGDLVTSQSHFSRQDDTGLRHAWDVHWRISNSHAIAEDVLSLDRIEAAGIRPEALEGLLAPERGDALLLACIHRIAHHHDESDLVWLYDIHLLAESLSASEWKRFEVYAKACGAWPLCARSLALARDRFSTRVPLVVSDDDAVAAERQSDARGGWREIDVLRVNLCALPTWSDRLRLVREHLFPPAAYITDKYRVAHRAALPFAYLRRIATGAPKWFRRHDADGPRFRRRLQREPR